MGRETAKAVVEPLGFRAAAPTDASAPVDAAGERVVFVVEARGLGGHLKEALVSEGETGARWRLLSDEGRHLKGTDLAPFPLGFFNAGLAADLFRRLLRLTSAEGTRIESPALHVRNFYSLTGSFARGDGEGFAEPAEVVLETGSGADDARLGELLKEATRRSPAFDAMSRPLSNSFALYVNGRRRRLSELREAGGEDARDPYLVHGGAPTPDPSAPENAAPVIRKTGVVEPGELSPAPVGTSGRILRTVAGRGDLLSADGVVDVDTWLELPGVSHFAIVSDERPTVRAAPTGLAHLSAAVAFCFMTQLSRYIEHLKLEIGDVRLVQRTPFAIVDTPDGPRGVAEPVETHLFLDGRADGETHERLMRVAARTCYLHATLAAELPPQTSVRLRVENSAA